jgi:hypothetical protein
MLTPAPPSAPSRRHSRWQIAPCGKPPVDLPFAHFVSGISFALCLRRLVAARGLNRSTWGWSTWHLGTRRVRRWRSILPKSEAARWCQARAYGGVLMMGSSGRQERSCAWRRRSWGRTGRSRGLEPGNGRRGISGLELDDAGKVGGWTRWCPS